MTLSDAAIRCSGKVVFLCAALLAVVPSAAVAAGINLSWDDCGTHGTYYRTFACNTNSGTNTLVASFVAPAGVEKYLSCESELEIYADAHALPDWWKFKNAGTCRQTAMTATADFTSGPFNCIDFFMGRAAGGIGAYDIGYPGTNGSRLKLVMAVPAVYAGPLVEGDEYYAYKLSISNIKSVGVGACAGCAVVACIDCRSIKLVQPSALNDNRTLTNPVESVLAFWQATRAGCYGVPTRRTTWGALKSLYR